MNAERFHDPRRFLDEATAFLLRDEARHNLMLGLSDTLASHPALYPERSFWVVREGYEIVTCALRTSPYNLVLAQPRDDEALAALVAAIDDELPGVVGAVPEVDDFAAQWDAEARVVREQGVYALQSVAEVPRPAGSPREAGVDDVELILEWFVGFVREALPDEEHDPSALARQIRQRLGSSTGGFTIWDDGDPVSMSGYGGRTPNGIRIGPVYTPPEHRGRGYATSLVAEQSTRLLREGRTFCFLYTDLANPTSNAIYERIGYARVCDSRQIAFE